MIRSLLTIPAHADRLIAGAHEHGADAIILDLDKTVPSTETSRARDMLPQSVSSAGRNGAKVFVLVSSQAEAMCRDAEAACRAGAFGLCVPKSRDADMFADLAADLAPVERSTGRGQMALVALIQDAAAVLDARAIAASPHVFALATFGDELAIDMAAIPSTDVLRLPKLMVHYAAKAEGKLSFGLLRSIANFADLSTLAAAAGEAKAHGFNGAPCALPSIVPIFNAAFSPTVEEGVWPQCALRKGAKVPIEVDGNVTTSAFHVQLQS